MHLKAIEKIGIGLSALVIGGLIIQATTGGSRASTVSTADYHYQGNPNTLVLIEKRTSTPSSVVTPPIQPPPILEESAPEEPTDTPPPSDSVRNYFSPSIEALRDTLNQWSFLKSILEDIGLDNIFIQPPSSPIALMSVAYAAEAETACSKETFKDILQYLPDKATVPLSPAFFGISADTPSEETVLRVNKDAVYIESSQPISLAIINKAVNEMQQDPLAFFQPLFANQPPSNSTRGFYILSGLQNLPSLIVQWGIPVALEESNSALGSCLNREQDASLNFIMQFMTDYKLADWLSNVADDYSEASSVAASSWAQTHPTDENGFENVGQGPLDIDLSKPSPLSSYGAGFGFEISSFLLQKCEETSNVHSDWELTCKIQKWFVGKT